jgi:hypothetical protein
MLDYKSLDYANFLLGTVLGSALTFHGNQLATRNHEEEMKLQQSHHDIEMSTTRNLHQEELALSKQLHMMEINSGLQQHIQSLNSDVIAANRESERDMYEQRNQQYGTVILSSTIMFTALCTVMFQAQLPPNSGYVVEVSMATSAGASFALLFLCIVLCTKLIVRTSQFMYVPNRSNFVAILKIAIANESSYCYAAVTLLSLLLFQVSTVEKLLGGIPRCYQSTKGHHEETQVLNGELFLVW